MTIKRLGFGIACTVLVALLSGCDAADKNEFKRAAAKLKFWEQPEPRFKISVVNLSTGSFFTPILAIGHPHYQTRIFSFGEPASEELTAIANDGNYDLLAQQFELTGDEVVRNPANDLLGPGETTEFTLAQSNAYITLVAMVLPTNDGLIALDSVNLTVGEHFLYVIDAGTEANNERIASAIDTDTSAIAADPGNQADLQALGIAGVVAEGSVQIHPGISGAKGSALNPNIHGWNGPIASVVISM